MPLIVRFGRDRSPAQEAEAAFAHSVQGLSRQAPDTSTTANQSAPSRHSCPRRTCLWPSGHGDGGQTHSNNWSHSGARKDWAEESHLQLSTIPGVDGRQARANGIVRGAGTTMKRTYHKSEPVTLLMLRADSPCLDCPEATSRPILTFLEVPINLCWMPSKTSKNRIILSRYSSRGGFS